MSRFMIRYLVPDKRHHDNVRIEFKVYDNWEAVEEHISKLKAIVGDSIEYWIELDDGTETHGHMPMPWEICTFV